MIHLTRLNRLPIVLNADLIESIEVTPDTVIALTTGQKMVVLEKADEVVRKVVEFRRAIYAAAAPPVSRSAADGQELERNGGDDSRA